MLTQAIYKFEGLVDAFLEGNEFKKKAYLEFFEENETLGFEEAEKNLIEKLKRLEAKEENLTEI